MVRKFLSRKRSFPTLAIVLFVAFAPAYPSFAQDERILSFHSDITIDEDGSMTVRETIRVRAQGLKIKRGIYRDFPTTYRDRAGKRPWPAASARVRRHDRRVRGLLVQPVRWCDPGAGAAEHLRRERPRVVQLHQRLHAHQPLP